MTFERPMGGGGGPEPEGDLGTAHAIGTDERRMHVRAYNHWVSLLDGRPYPAVEDIDRDAASPFAPHGVLLDFRAGIDDPRIRTIGGLLREECGIDESIRRVSDVPPRSLLSRLTDHYLQIIANRAPIGFEAEFVGTRGTTMMYRGILMPFSSDGAAIDFIYGVINWKELLDEAGTTELRLEMEQALTRAPRADAPTIWEDGPSHLAEPPLARERGGEPDAPPPAEAADAETNGLADCLALAREDAERARSVNDRGREALYRAIGRAYDVALAAKADPEGYGDVLADNGLTAQARAPMTPIAKLVFGADHDKTRLAEIASALAAATRADVPVGGAAEWIGGFAGGLKGVVAAERSARRPAAGPDRLSVRKAAAACDCPDLRAAARGERGVRAVRRAPRRQRSGRTAGADRGARRRGSRFARARRLIPRGRAVRRAACRR